MVKIMVFSIHHLDFLDSESEDEDLEPRRRPASFDGVSIMARELLIDWIDVEDHATLMSLPPLLRMNIDIEMFHVLKVNIKNVKAELDALKRS